MAISPGQAAAALEEIERTQRRTRISGGYATASPHLILWGCLWAVGYAGCGLLPIARWGLVWLPLVVIGAVGSTWLGSRATGVASGGSRMSFWRPVGLILSIALFIGATFSLFRSSDPIPYLVFPALVTGLVYALAGLLAGLPRFAAIGAAIAIVTLAGSVAAPAFTAFWVAIAGGGGLILGGWWLRQV
ncbi:MAG TPA: hypothetical protein VFW19_05190 [Allosphingosinicella sp.]|nr:hypothetical protein [Allosphingosinicella sp.]